MAPSNHDPEPDFLIASTGEGVVGGCGNDREFVPSLKVRGLVKVFSQALDASA
jgi:hypothetical protein